MVSSLKKEKIGNNGLRLGGSDRFETVKLIAEDTVTGNIDNIILASGNNWYDSLLGSTLSKNYNDFCTLSIWLKSIVKACFIYKLL